MDRFDWFAPHMRVDPYPDLHRFRAESPIQHTPEGWWVLGFEEANLVLKDSRFGRDRAVFLEDFRRTLGDGPAYEYVIRRMTYYGPPDHGRIRGIVAGAFTPRRIEGLRPFIQRITHELLDAAPDHRRFDLLEAVGHPLPSLVICELLGVPNSMREDFDRWTQDIAHLISPMVTDEQRRIGRETVIEEWACVEDIITHRAKSLGDDLLSALIQAEFEGERLTREELVANVMFMFSAGHQTTRDSLGMGVLGLLRHPTEWRRLAADPDESARQATEECLRYESPVCIAQQHALTDTEVAGVRIPRGETINVLVNAANRDPRRFPVPDRLWIDRPDNHPMAFSGGPHLCLGAALARVEVSVVLAELAKRFPDLDLTGEEVRWRDTAVFRGPQELWVSA